jgi:hypothetical protein
VLGLGAQRQRAAAGKLDLEAHHHLVDRADLLDVEGAVGEALALQDQEALEDAPDRAVRHHRQALRCFVR